VEICETNPIFPPFHGLLHCERLIDHFVGARRDSGTVIANGILDLTSGYVDKT
jgi:hypothetical protein